MKEGEGLETEPRWGISWGQGSQGFSEGGRTGARMNGRWGGFSAKGRRIAGSLPSSGGTSGEPRADPRVPCRGNPGTDLFRDNLVAELLGRWGELLPGLRSCVNLERGAARASAVPGGRSQFSTPPSLLLSRVIEKRGNPSSRAGDTSQGHS